MDVQCRAERPTGLRGAFAACVFGARLLELAPVGPNGTYQCNSLDSANAMPTLGRMSQWFEDVAGIRVDFLSKPDGSVGASFPLDGEDL